METLECAYLSQYSHVIAPKGKSRTFFTAVPATSKYHLMHRRLSMAFTLRCTGDSPQATNAQVIIYLEPCSDNSKVKPLLDFRINNLQAQVDRRIIKLDEKLKSVKFL